MPLMTAFLQGVQGVDEGGWSGYPAGVGTLPSGGREHALLADRQRGRAHGLDGVVRPPRPRLRGLFQTPLEG